MVGRNEIQARKVRAEIDAANEELEKAVDEHQRVCQPLQEELKNLGSRGMLSEQQIAHETLVNFETVGDLPDLETYQLCVEEQRGCRKLADRYSRMIEECESNENLRHLPTKHSPASNMENSPTENDD